VPANKTRARIGIGDQGRSLAENKQGATAATTVKRFVRRVAADSSRPRTVLGDMKKQSYDVANMAENLTVSVDPLAEMYSDFSVDLDG
jgi:hypothetical protein